MSESSNPIFDAVCQALESVSLNLPDGVLPDPALLQYYTFLNERKLFLEEDVDFPVMNMIKLIMRWNQEDKDIPVEQRKPIFIYIMSNGGYMSYMWAMLDAMLTSKTPIVTVNLGIAASAASLIFLAGSKRIMMPTSTVIIHEGFAEVAGEASKVVDATRNYKKELAKMKEFILARTKIPQQMLTKKARDDWYMNAETCIEYGVCHNVVESLDEIM